MSFKKLAPNRTVVTSFTPQKGNISYDNGSTALDEDGVYVLHVCSGGSCDSMIPTPPPPSSKSSSRISCALSDRSIVTYDRETMHVVHTVPEAHSSTITDLSHHGVTSSAGDQHIISSGMDACVRIFDVRCSSSSVPPAMQMNLPAKEGGALSFSLGYDGTLAAVGGEGGNIYFYDLRQLGGNHNSHNNSNLHESPLLGSYVNAHTDEVTRVRFQPNTDSSSLITSSNTSLLVSVSEDGLASIHDTSKPTEDSALISTMNIGSPIRSVGFFGPSMEGLYCLTGAETLSLWHHDSAQLLCDFGHSTRELLTAAIGVANTHNHNAAIEYLVGCHWDAPKETLSVIAGNNNGDTGIFSINGSTNGYNMTLTSTITGGHRSCIRSFAYTQNQCIYTGGEDARLCEWNLLDNRHTQPAQKHMMTKNKQNTNSKEMHKHSSSHTLPQNQKAIPHISGGGPIRRNKKKLSNHNHHQQYKPY
mmetsp:Transcript_194/g.296  ORF Transcript_194/g.296 Transcript_194/m.296 type:complete len:474 (-) Transcript_194:32-1453(-)